MRAPFGAGVLLAILVSGCGPKVDLAKGLEVMVVSSGWFDVGMVDGQNKIVPSITFRLKNTSDQELKALHTNAVFRQVGSPDEWGSQFSIVRGSDGLAPGETTDTITLRSLNGYTSAAPRAEFFTNKQFVDAKAELFAKYSSVQWKRIGDLTVERRLIAN
jgi:hypothetical protein